MRCFVAVPLPRRVQEAVAGLVGRLKPRLPSARFVRLEQLHLTLHFFEDLDAPAVARLAEAVRRGAAAMRPFLVSFGDLGVFPDPGRARVLWVGLREGADSLGRLHARIAANLRAAGLPVEGRPFRPHLTLARMARPGPVSLREPGVAAGVAWAFTADQVVLFESVLGPAGAVHSRLVTAVLGTASEGSDGG